ncbi:uncharacterized protein isoform X1 [Choristoneura fumiferana]|uniref:uncharacterized protein isoform X1 n=1 Tax=Choristoneura fumiferana TaxID=7141 RepID=UPI003D15AFFC
MDEIKNMKLPRALIEELRKAEQRPTWESSNEGVHERVNFDDTLWGLSLAGGAYYNTPLRVTQVKEGSRAEHAGIQVGDFLQSINDVDSTTLTIQQAHDMILESGLEIKFVLSAPDVEESMHVIYQDFIEDEIIEKKRLRESKIQEKQRVFKGAKTNDAWSLAWPCNKKRDIRYRESNCCLVPSRYESTQAATPRAAQSGRCSDHGRVSAARAALPALFAPVSIP